MSGVNTSTKVEGRIELFLIASRVIIKSCFCLFGLISVKPRPQSLTSSRSNCPLAWKESSLSMILLACYCNSELISSFPMLWLYPNFSNTDKCNSLKYDPSVPLYFKTCKLSKNSSVSIFFY